MQKFEISNNIRKLRFFANEMTQQELAKKTDVSRQTIMAIESGKYSPSLELAVRIAYTFNVKLDEVFDYTVNEESEEKKK